MNAEVFLSLLDVLRRSTPHLPGAACRELPAVMDQVNDPQPAFEICDGCTAFEACRAWADDQPGNTLNGIIAGRVYVWVSHPSLRRPPQTTEAPTSAPAQTLTKGTR